MLPRYRRSFYPRLALIAIVLVCILIFTKTINKSTDPPSEPEGLSLSNAVVDVSLKKKWSPLERMVLADLAKQRPGLGDDGKSVILEGEEKVRGEAKLQTIALNEELSEHLSYNRTTPDARNPLCRTITFDRASLPTASVVIIFYNEPYSVLVRTVHSVLNTADRQVLKEIILVDDGSSNVELHEKLDYYLATRLPQDAVKTVRLKNRLGLIRARLAGARIARGEVLVFLDAHCECVVDWLEPLLARIQESRTSVLVPIIDVIDAKDFQYSANGYQHFQVGGFSWNGHFDWIDVPKRERERQRQDCKVPTEICPTYSPTMAGGLFAISRDYFWEIGSYDEQMDGWGGENLEMSFRIWQCGGTIETIPCSRVGHIFRDFHPYSFPDDRDTHGINTVRMALVWMDDYIELFYMNRPDLKNNVDVGDVTHRRILRNKLKCKNFDWYLKNIYPEKFIPTKDMIGYGRFVSLASDLCFDDLQQNNEEPYNLGLYTCQKSDVTKSQFFSLTRDGVLRNELSCATVQRSSSTPFLVVMAPCQANNKHNEKWEYFRGQLRHIDTGLCIEQKGLRSHDFVVVDVCEDDTLSQKWRIEH